MTNYSTLTKMNNYVVRSYYMECYIQPLHIYRKLSYVLICYDVNGARQCVSALNARFKSARLPYAVAISRVPRPRKTCLVMTDADELALKFINEMSYERLIDVAYDWMERDYPLHLYDIHEKTRDEYMTVYVRNRNEAQEILNTLINGLERLNLTENLSFELIDRCEKIEKICNISTLTLRQCESVDNWIDEKLNTSIKKDELTILLENTRKLTGVDGSVTKNDLNPIESNKLNFDELNNRFRFELNRRLSSIKLTDEVNTELKRKKQCNWKRNV